MSTSANVQSLIQQSGVAAETANMFSATDYGQMIQNGIGADLTQITSEETVIVSVVIDDSSSIESGNNTDLVIKGHNQIIRSLKETKQRNNVMFQSLMLNNGVFNALNILDLAKDLDDNNYRPYGCTPLYDRTKQTLATVLATTGHFAQAGQQCRSITVIVTDGADVGSREADASDIGIIVKDMQREEAHIVAAVGIDDGGTDFRAVFNQMGIKDNWILTPANNDSDIRRAFNVISQRVSQASQGATNFSNAATGGFGI
jgi:hypothetical protein